jgi:CRISPR-associated protein Cas1
MKKHLNTLYVSTQGSYLFKEGECLCMKVGDETRAKLPIHALDSIVCFGNVMCSPWLFAHCAENDVSVSLLTESGRFLASVRGEQSGNVLLRRQQYRWGDSPEESGRVARACIAGKIANARVVFRRAARDRPGTPVADAITDTAEKLTRMLGQLETTFDLETLRGLEGIAANLYWSVFDLLITNRDFQFTGRNRRPPLDPVNCLLSFIYTLLAHDVRSALETVGLDPQVGFLHRDRPGRPSLALDLMEEFRPCLADRLVLSLINREQLKMKDFLFTESGAVVMKDDARKSVITAWQERKKEELTHSFTGEKMPVGLLWHIQSQLLARHIRGDIDEYPPFVWR